MRRGLIAAGIGVVTLLAACGGSSGLTKAQYVKRANAVCRAAAEQVAALPIPDDRDLDRMPKAAAAIVKVGRDAVDRLRSIRPPKEDKVEIAKWIALVDQTIDQAETSAESQQDGDIPRATTANVNGAALDRRADELASAYGLDRCVHASAPPSGATTTTTTLGG